MKDKDNQNGQPPKNAAYKLVVRSEEKTYTGYLKEPNRDTIDMAMGYVMGIMEKPKYLAAGEIVINHCWVGGDEELKDTNSKVGMSAAMQAFQAIQMLDGEVVELKKSTNS